MDAVFNPKSQKTFRQALRNHCSEPERKLWFQLRNGQMGVKFRRQAGFGPYIADFYCPELRLIIEVDGDSHAGARAEAHDAKRQAYLVALGLQVQRFSNRDVLGNMEGVLSVLVALIAELRLKHTPAESQKTAAD